MINITISVKYLSPTNFRPSRLKASVFSCHGSEVEGLSVTECFHNTSNNNIANKLASYVAEVMSNAPYGGGVEYSVWDVASVGSTKDGNQTIYLATFEAKNNV